MNSTISILGCGWLGLPLAKKLLKQKNTVNGSYRVEDTKIKLSNIGVNPHKIVLDDNSVFGDFESFIRKSNCLIIAIPPGLRKQPQSNFSKKIENLIPYIKNSNLKKIIFISSTSVFENSEAPFNIYNENSLPNAKSNVGKQLYEVEKQLMELNTIETKIIRFSGLFNNERHPARFLSLKTTYNSQSPVNLIHLEDCISLLLKVITLNTNQNIFHGVNPNHPLREKYYSEKCLEFNIKPPNFISNKDTGKIILGDQTSKTLGLEYLYDL